MGRKVRFQRAGGRERAFQATSVRLFSRSSAGRFASSNSQVMRMGRSPSSSTRLTAPR